MNIQPGWVAIVHPVHGVLHWHRSGSEKDYWAEASKQGAAARMASDLSFLPKGYSGPVTVDESGCVLVLDLEPTENESSIKSLDSIIANPSPSAENIKTLARILRSLF